MAVTRITQAEKAIGRRIRKHRRNKELTQEDLAEIIGVTPTHVSLIETGSRRASLKLLHKIASTLNVKVKDIL